MSKAIPILPCPGGMNNVLAPSHARFQPRVSNGQPVPPEFMQSIIDLDLDSDGALSTRAGLVQELALTAGKTLWAGADTLLIQEAGTISKVTLGVLNTKTPLVTGLSASARVLFHEHAGQVFWTNGITQGRIASGTSLNWGCAVCPTPTVGSTTGSLPVGEYRVAATFVDASGIEHGADLSASITLTTAKAITVLLSAVDAAAAYVRLYLAGPNDDRLFHAKDVAVSAMPTTITTLPMSDYQCNRVGCVGPPAVTALWSWRDYLITASGSWLYPSVGAAAHLFQIDQTGIQFPETILAGVGLPTGFWVVGESDAYWVSGDSHPKTWKVIPLNLDCGFAKGGVTLSSGLVPALSIKDATPIAVFASSIGLAFGLPDGSMLLPMQNRYHLDVAGKVASFAYYRNGANIPQLICTLS